MTQQPIRRGGLGDATAFAQVLARLLVPAQGGVVGAPINRRAQPGVRFEDGSTRGGIPLITPTTLPPPVGPVMTTDPFTRFTEWLSRSDRPEDFMGLPAPPSADLDALMWSNPVAIPPAPPLPPLPIRTTVPIIPRRVRSGPFGGAY